MSSISDHTQTPSGVISANPQPNAELVLCVWCGIRVRGVLSRVLLKTDDQDTDPLPPQGLCFFGKVCRLCLRTKLRGNPRQGSFSEPRVGLNIAALKYWPIGGRGGTCCTLCKASEERCWHLDGHTQFVYET